MPSIKGVMAAGIGGTTSVYWCIMILGYGTFGRNTQRLLLNNYHASHDKLAVFARLAMGVAVISGYALMFSGLKAALFSLLKLDQSGVENKDKKQDLLSAIVLAIIAVSACFVTEREIGTIIGLTSSLFGSIVIYMLPAFVSNSLLQAKDRAGRRLTKPFFAGEALFNKALVVIGVVFASLGTWVSLTGVEEL